MMESALLVGDFATDHLNDTCHDVFCPRFTPKHAGDTTQWLFPNHVLVCLDDNAARHVLRQGLKNMRIVTHELGRPYEIPSEMINALRGQGTAGGAELLEKIQMLAPEYRVQFFLDEVTRFLQGIPFRATPAKGAAQRGQTHV